MNQTLKLIKDLVIAGLFDDRSFRRLLRNGITDIHGVKNEDNVIVLEAEDRIFKLTIEVLPKA